ncbi:MAG: EamA family transporter [Desulfobacterales bacterium]|nr:EamA family transporter [Desulfobacterales bacterium]
MSSLTVSFILTSISLSVGAQILFKCGMSAPKIQTALNTENLSALWPIIGNPYIWGGLTAYALSATLWLLVLSKVEVSQAYPFVGLGFIGTMVFGNIVLNEPITGGKFVGTLLVVTGVILISR